MMLEKTYRFALLLVATAASACGPARAPAAAPAGEGRAASSAGSDVGAPADKADPAAAPQLLVTLRFAHPESTMKSVLSTFPRDVPPMARDIRKFLRMGVGKIADSLALDRPMDFYVFQRSANPAIVFSGVLRDDVKPRSELARFRLTEMPEGRFGVKPPHPFSTDLGAAKECEVDESARTVTCSNADGFLDRTRSQRPVRATPKADVWAVMDREPIKDQMLKDERREKATAEASDEGRAIGRALEHGLFDDLRSVEAAANLSQDAAGVSFTLNLIDGRSLVAKILGSTAPASAPPPRFFRFPVDSGVAVFTGGVEADVWEPIKKEFVESVVAASTKETEYPEPIVNEARQMLGQMFFTGGSWMLAFGNRPSAYRDLFVERAANRSRAGAQKMTVSHVVKEWVILEIDEPGEKVVAQAKRFLDFSRRADASGRSKPSAPAAGKSSDDDLGKWKADAGGVVSSLPRATLHFSSRATKFEKLRNDKVVETRHILVVPEGDHTWIGYAEDEKTIVDHLKSVLDGGPKRGTLAALPGIDVLSSMGPLTGGGLFTLKSLVEEPKETTKPEATALDEKLKYIEAVPSKGNAPYFFGIHRAAEGSPQITIETKTPTRSLQELVGFLRLDDSK
jgi:hypothetical protein